MAPRWLSTLRKWTANRPRSVRFARPGLEALEDRRLPAALTVWSGADSGAGSLRGAIAAAHDGDTITFAGPSAITLTNGPLAITRALTIQGPGANGLTVSGNHVSDVFENYSSAGVTLSGLTIADGSAGGVVNRGTLTLSSCTVMNNASPGSGGGVVNFGTLTLSHCMVTGNNAAQDGAGADNTGTLTLDHCLVWANTAGHDGAGVYSSGGQLTIQHSSVSGNTAAHDGGGLYYSHPSSSAHGTVNACTIWGNGAANGGGIYQEAGSYILDVTNSTLAYNSAANQGGGLDAESSWPMLISCTLTQNTADTGGAIFSRYGLGIQCCTIARNTANSFGGGLFAASLGTTLENSIVADNHVASWLQNLAGIGTDVWGPIVSWGYDLIQSTLGASIVTNVGGNIYGVDARLGPLGDNGGTTQTMELLPDSPAQGTGNAADTPVYDQRGVHRLIDVEGNVVMNLGAVASVPEGTTATHFRLDARNLSGQPGDHFRFTLTAVDGSGNLVPTFRDTVALQSSDRQAVFPAVANFAQADHPGSLDFDVVLKTSGSQTVTLTNPSDPALQITVTCQVADPLVPTQIRLDTAGGVAIAGQPFAVTVTALDPFGNVVRGCTDTIRLTGPDGLNRSYTLMPTDQGAHTFANVVLTTPGPQQLSASLFHPWGQVTNPLTGMTTTVGATFTAGRPLQVVRDVSASVRPAVSWVSSGSLLTRQARALLTITNPGPTLSGPFEVVLTGLSLGLRVQSESYLNATGTWVPLSGLTTTSGSVAFAIPRAALASLATRASLQLSVTFSTTLALGPSGQLGAQMLAGDVGV
jgi:hypothetical protein